VTRQPFSEAFDATPRTPLYPLVPIGLGTGQVESLTGYLARLAHAHRISVGTLFREVMEPQIRAAELYTASMSLGNRLSEQELQPIDVQPSWVPTIEALTGQRSLSELTVSTWRHVVAQRRLLRREGAYCPPCLAGDLKTVGPYERLSWRLSSVEVCSRHGTVLLTACWKCGSRRPSLGFWSVPGYCGRCWSWLGWRRAEPRPEPKAPSTWSRVRSTLVEAALAERAVSQSPRGAFRDSLQAALRLTAGSQTAINRMLGLRAKSNATNWLARSLVPSLDTALRLAAAFGADLTSILAGSPIFDVRRRFQPPLGKGRRHMDWAVVGRELSGELRVPQTRSLEAIARDLGTARQELKEHFPELSQAVIDRHRAALHERSERRRLYLVEAVEGIVSELQLAGIHPSARAVEAALPDGINLRETALSEAWRRAVRDKGDSPIEGRVDRLGAVGPIIS